MLQVTSGYVRHVFSNYRDLYGFRYASDSTHFSKELKEIPNNCIVEYLFESNVKTFTSRLCENFEMIIGLDTKSQLNYKFQTLDFRVQSLFEDEEQVEHIEYLCKSNHRLRDLELTLGNNAFVLRILKSLENNYMIKTIRLSCHEPVSKEIIEYARWFKSQRVGLDMSFNSKLKEFRALNKKVSESYYPDEFYYD